MGHELGVHADARESGHGVDLVEPGLEAPTFDQEVDARQPGAAGRPERPQGEVSELGGDFGGEPDRDRIAGDIVDVLALVGVPLAVGQDDLAGGADQGLGAPIAEYGELDLAGVEASLDHHLGVVAQGQVERRLELAQVPGPTDAHRRALVGGFDEQGEAFRLAQGRGSGPDPVSIFDQRVDVDPRGHVDVVGAGLDVTLEGGLVHAERRCEHSRTHIGDSKDLEQALERAVFSVWAVEQREHAGAALEQSPEVGRGLTCIDDRLEGQVALCRPGPKLASTGQADQHRFKALAVDGREDLCGAANRDLVLGGPTAVHQGEALLAHLGRP